MNLYSYPTLYSRTSTGAIQTWRAELNPQNLAQYRTVSGQLNGQPVETEWKTAKAKNVGKKNATTAQQQAHAEICALYTKKRKIKYFDNIENIDEESYFKPMLAKSYKDYKDKIDFKSSRWCAQIKYNGIRCIARKEGLFTRKGEQITCCPHIEKALEEFFHFNPKAILDGELFNELYRQQLNEIVKLTRRSKDITPELLQRSRDIVHYVIYDINTENKYEDRIKEALEPVAINNNQIIHFAETILIFDQNDFDTYYEGVIHRGHEGIMIRNLESLYEKDRRSSNLLKVKPTDTDEFVILDIQEGDGNWQNKAKIITVQMKDGKVFDATFKGDMVKAAEVLLDKQTYIGQTVTLHYNGFTGLGTPNNAQWDINNYLRND